MGKFGWFVAGLMLGELDRPQHHKKEDDYVEEYKTVTLNYSEIIKWVERGDMLKLPLSIRLKALEILEKSHPLDLSLESIDARLILENSLPPKLKGKRVEAREKDDIEYEFKKASTSEEPKMSDDMLKYYGLSGISMLPQIESLISYDRTQKYIEHNSCLTKAQKRNLCKLRDKYRKIILQTAQSKGKCNNPEERNMKEKKYRERIVEIFQDNKIKRADKLIYYDNMKEPLRYDFDLIEAQKLELCKFIDGYKKEIMKMGTEGEENIKSIFVVRENAKEEDIDYKVSRSLSE